MEGFETLLILFDLLRVGVIVLLYLINFSDCLRRKVILCYPEWTSKEIFMGDIQRSGLDLVKDKSYDFAWKEKITVDDHAYDLLINGIEQCYWNRVLMRVFYNSDEDDIEDVKEDAVEDVNKDVDEEMGYEDEDEDEAEFDEFDKLHDPHFF
ncbi:hypothetical protein SO802_017143 [Lithocarpus litseifolius]|uniref:Uncharacterized protein n=1 Tax=Lithocarpus litseifolius TaxID=425828 RepID=A0AAW2D0K1_9ROSI